MIIKTKSLPPRICSTEDAAEIIGCHRSRVRQYVSDGTLRSYRLGERAIMLDLSQVTRVARDVNGTGRPRGGTVND